MKVSHGFVLNSMTFSKKIFHLSVKSNHTASPLGILLKSETIRSLLLPLQIIIIVHSCLYFLCSCLRGFSAHGPIE